MPRRFARSLSLLIAAAVVASHAAGCAAGNGDAFPVGTVARPASIELDVRPDGVPPPSPAVTAKLSAKVADAELHDTPLVDVLAAIQRQQGVTISVDWTGMEAAGILRDVRLYSKVSLRGVTVAETLRLVLEDISTPTAKVVYAVRGNTIHVATTEQIDAINQSVRVYDIGDLLVSERTRHRAIAGLPPGPPETRPAGNEIFCGPSDTQQIIDLIVRVAAPGEWRDDGARNGRIMAFNSRLVIQQSPYNHKRVEAVLAALRATAAVPQPPAR